MRVDEADNEGEAITMLQMQAIAILSRMFLFVACVRDRSALILQSFARLNNCSNSRFFPLLVIANLLRLFLTISPASYKLLNYARQEKLLLESAVEQENNNSLSCPPKGARQWSRRFESVACVSRMFLLSDWSSLFSFFQALTIYPVVTNYEMNHIWLHSFL